MHSSSFQMNNEKLSKLLKDPEFYNIARNQTSDIINREFNQINWELMQKAFPEDNLIRYPEGMTEEEINDHYPMHLIIFEAKTNFINDKIMDNIDALYNIRIGVIAAKEISSYTNACLFIPGMGYDFYRQHWIPLFIEWELINPDRILEEILENKKAVHRKRLNLEDKDLMMSLLRLSNNEDPLISRHSNGLLKALNENL